MVQVARWLQSEVGIGAVFKKQELRAAFPTVGQVDRRMRDLRDFDWVIDTNREDASLRPDELRFVAEGQAVWNRSAVTRSLPAALRRQALLDADFSCRYCGTPAGEAFADAPSRKAILSVTRDSSRSALVVACQLCRELATGVVEARFVVLFTSLSPAERALVREALAGSGGQLSRVRTGVNLARSIPAARRVALMNVST